MKSRTSFLTWIQRGLVWSAAVLVCGFLLLIIACILINGLPALNAGLFSWTYNTENVSLLPARINTLVMIALTLVIVMPAGLGAAIYLNEYTSPDSRTARMIAAAAEVLSSVPSIVFGLFGSLFFVRFLNMGMSLIAGSLTMAIIILPLILRTAQQALSEVPTALREGSYGLGAGKLRTIFCIVLPQALPGILSGTILAIGRITGESAALIFTAGTAVAVAGTLSTSARTLAVHMYALASEGLYMQQTWATAVILLLMVFILNGISSLIRRWIQRRHYG